MSVLNIGITNKNINGKNYQITLLPAREGLTLGIKLTKLVGVSLGTAFDSGGFSDSDDNYKMDNMGRDIAIALVDGLDRVDVVDVVVQIVRNLTVDGRAVDFDEHFRGNYGELIAVVQWALQENFGDFLTGFLKAKGIDTSEILTKFQEMTTPQNKQVESSELSPKE